MICRVGTTIEDLMSATKNMTFTIFTLSLIDCCNFMLLFAAWTRTAIGITLWEAGAIGELQVTNESGKALLVNALKHQEIKKPLFCRNYLQFLSLTIFACNISKLLLVIALTETQGSGKRRDLIQAYLPVNTHNREPTYIWLIQFNAIQITFTTMMKD